jgi:hypothetical protein
MPKLVLGFCNLAIGQVHLRYYFHFRALRFGGSDFVAPAFVFNRNEAGSVSAERGITKGSCDRVITANDCHHPFAVMR